MSMLKKFRHPVTYIRENRAEKVFKQISPYLKKPEKILDVGCGSCFISKKLIENGFSVTSLDVENKSSFEEIKPVIYQGRKMPFKDKSFNSALLLMVLHHVKYPELVLKESMRVAKELIIIEDIYTHKLNKLWVQCRDSLLNFQFRSHPHNNKKDSEWQKLFKDLGLRILDLHYRKSFLFPKTEIAIYHLTKNILSK